MPCSPPDPVSSNPFTHPPPSLFWFFFVCHIHFQDKKFFKGFFVKVSYCFVTLSVFSPFLLTGFIIFFALHCLITPDGWKKHMDTWGKWGVVSESGQTQRCMCLSRWGGLGWGRVSLSHPCVCVFGINRLLFLQPFFHEAAMEQRIFPFSLLLF